MPKLRPFFVQKRGCGIGAVVNAESPEEARQLLIEKEKQDGMDDEDRVASNTTTSDFRELPAEKGVVLYYAD